MAENICPYARNVAESRQTFGHKTLQFFIDASTQQRKTGIHKNHEIYSYDLTQMHNTPYKHK